MLPDNVEAQVKAAAFLLAARQFEDAKARAEKALAKDPKNVDAQVILGNALAGLKNFEDAVKELEEAVRLDPNSAVAYASLGAVAGLERQQAGGRGGVSKGRRDKPEPVSGAPRAGQFPAGRPVGRRGRRRRCSRAAELDPANPLAHRALAAFYMGTRRPAEAEPHLKALADADT